MRLNKTMLFIVSFNQSILYFKCHGNNIYADDIKNTCSKLTGMNDNVHNFWPCSEFTHVQCTGPNADQVKRN